MASALIEMRNSPHPVLHLTHPRPVTWSQIVNPISRILNLPLVPFTEWLERLRASATATSIKGNGLVHTTAATKANPKSEEDLLRVNPGLMLVDFFSGAVAEKTKDREEAMGLRTMDVSRAVEVAPSLGEGKLKSLGEDDMKRWIGYWRRIRFLE